jgi:hypothetical protein
MKKFLLTLIFILFLIFLFLFWGGALFTKMSIEATISELKDSINFTKKELFTHDKLADQPELIRNYFHSTISDSVFVPKFVTLKQSAQFKTDLNSDWITLKATQYFTTATQNFLWFSEMQTSKFFWVNAIESYIEGKGNMLIKLNSSITIADSWGLELDKSSLFRYISEAVLFPTQLLPSKKLSWSILDTNIAEIKFKDSGTSVVAKIYFNNDSTIEKIETRDKYRAQNREFKESLYTIYFSDYKRFDESFLVPSYFELEWELEEGKFKYGKFIIESITYE